ncbi:MAG: EAL domain-containing protein [Candidatus Limnocylindria bacterium]
MVPAIQVAYALAFPFAYGLLGPSIGVFPASSIMLAAWLLGLRVAALVAVFTVIVSTLLYIAVGIEPGSALRSSSLGAAVFLAIGFVIARVRSDKVRIERLTMFDALTNLPNRHVFHGRLESMLGRRTQIHVASVDVTGFREVSENFGHDAGEEVIVEVAKRLVAAFPQAVVARFGTADFAVVDATTGSDDLFAARALDVFRTPFAVAGSLLNVDGRVGIARSPEHGETSDTLIAAAESAVYAARRAAVPWSLASRTRSENGAERLGMLADLRQALDRDDLRLHYQPLLDVTNGQIVGFEALLRWQRSGALVPPGVFIPLAEQSGLIVPLTGWVVNEAARQLADWAHAGQVLRVSVNVGAKAIGGGSRLESAIVEATVRHSISPAQITVEVTETDVMMDPAQAARTLAALKKIGVRIAVDDFGTGYSSLGYLNQLPLDEVKIDRSFISRLTRDANTSSIVRAAVDLSHALGFDAVAEGVEDEATLERLTLLGCDRAQGYFIAKPMPADAVLPWLQRYAPTPTVVPAPQAAFATSIPADNAGMTTVLVVDDEPSLRVATHRILSGQGFNVLHAATASEALRISTEHGAAIDLVVTDIFLTDWRGHELAARLRETHPDLKFLFVSGDPKAGDLVQGAQFLAKPFSKQQLIDRVGIVLAA